DQDDEDQHGLDQEQPPRVVAEHGETVHRAAPFCLTALTVTAEPGEARSTRTPLPWLLAGIQTVSSGRSGAATTGSVTSPRSPVRVTWVAPASTSYVACGTATTAGRAVWASALSPTWRVPLSS